MLTRDKVLTKAGQVMAALLCLVVVPAWGFVTTPLETVDDTYVRQGSPNTVHGTQDFLIVKDVANTGANNIRKAFTRFDVSSVPVGSLIDASIELTLMPSPNLGNLTYDFEIHALTFEGNMGLGTGDFWTEGALTWNTAVTDRHGNAAGVGFNGADTSLLGTFQLTGDGTDGVNPSTITLTDAALGGNLLPFVNADTNGFVTLMIRRLTDAGGSHLFASHENMTAGAAGATLNVSYDVVPSPSSVALLSGALLVLVAVGGKRRGGSSAVVEA